jgi:hypothetical protein
MRPRVVQRGAIATRSPLSPYIDGLQWVAAGARSIASGVEAMKINAKVVGYGPDPERTQALVNVIVEFSGPTQSMTLTVIVPNEGDEAALEEQGIAKAKDLALQFAADRQ